VANKKLLKQPAEIPNKDHKFYLFKTDDIRIPGRLYGKSRHEDATSTQWERNKIITQLDENRDLHGRPKVTAPKNSNIKKANISNSPIEIIEYGSASQPPRYMQPANMPTWVREQIGRCDADLQENYSLSLLPNQTPPGVTSGRAIERLQEENDSMYSTVIRQWDEVKAKAWTAHLKLKQEFVTEPRELPIIEAGNITEKKTYVGSDILETNINIDAGSSMPKSKVATQMIIEQQWKDGWYGEPTDPAVMRHVHKKAQIGRLDVPMNDEDLEELNAQYACRKLIEGEMVPFQEFDMDMIWVNEFYTYLRKNRYALKQEQLDILYDYLRMREERLKKKAMAGAAPDIVTPEVIAAEQQMAGMPPGPGGPVVGPDGQPLPAGPPAQPAMPPDQILSLVG
jgi:hypothetical protein